MMQENLLLAAAADQNDWLNSLFLILGIGTAIAALIWLILWLCWWDSDDAGSSGESNAEDSAASAKKAEPTKETKAPTKKNEAEPEVSGDDFSKLGLSAATIAALNAKGINSYSQIADWGRDDIDLHAGEFGANEKGVDFAELPWKANALAEGVDLDSIKSDDPAFGAPFEAPQSVDHAALISSEFKGEKVTNDDDLGIIYAKGASASHTDDLTAIKGVGPVLRKELNNYGVFCYKQVASWSDHNVREFSERLNCFKNRIERDRWIPQASGLKCQVPEEEEFQAASEEEAAETFAEELKSGAVKQDPVYGILYAEKPEEVDDLKKIKGVAKVLEGKLNGIGVYRFKQVAVWTEPACEEFAKLLTAFKDRIYRDNWIAQAKRFHNEKYDEKL